MANHASRTPEQSLAALQAAVHGAPGGASAVQLQKLGKHLKQVDAVSDGLSMAVLPHGVQKVGGSNRLAPTNQNALPAGTCSVRISRPLREPPTFRG